VAQTSAPDTKEILKTEHVQIAQKEPSHLVIEEAAMPKFKKKPPHQNVKIEKCSQEEPKVVCRVHHTKDLKKVEHPVVQTSARKIKSSQEMEDVKCAHHTQDLKIGECPAVQTCASQVKSFPLMEDVNIAHNTQELKIGEGLAVQTCAAQLKSLPWMEVVKIAQKEKDQLLT